VTIPVVNGSVVERSLVLTLELQCKPHSATLSLDNPDVEYLSHETNLAVLHFRALRYIRTLIGKWYYQTI